jgi:F0F1-type ATP synthase assembly protein I
MWAGDRADRAWGTSPIFALSGALLGGAAGFYRLYAHLMALQNASAEDAEGTEEAE